MTEWLIQSSRVYTNGEGKSYNLTNRVTANDLHHTLTNYEKEIEQLQKQIQTDTNLDKIKQQIIALQMDIHNVQADLDKIKELIQ